MIFDTLSNLEMYAPVLPQLKTVAEAMDHDEIYDKAPGKYSTPDPNVTYEVMEVMTQAGDIPFKVHKNMSIVSIVLSGRELCSTTWRELKDEAACYDTKSDTALFMAEPISAFQATQGRFAAFLPGEPYKTSIALGGEAEPVKKVVFRVLEQ